MGSAYVRKPLDEHCRIASDPILRPRIKALFMTLIMLGFDSCGLMD
jgi:hypothetical protein